MTNKTANNVTITAENGDIYEAKKAGNTDPWDCCRNIEYVRLLKNLPD